MLEVNKIYCMDCLEGMKQLDDKSIDLVLTDPPYNIGQDDKLTKKNGIVQSNKSCWGEWDNLEYNSYLKFIESLMKECNRLMKDSASFIMFYDRFDMTYIRDFGKNLGWHTLNFYALVKNNPLPNMRKSGFCSGFELAIIFNKNKKQRKFNFLKQTEMINYFKYNNTIHKTSHPTEKPLEPLRRFCKILSCENDIVLDPFMGSGSTAVACKQTGRRFIGFEVNQEYVDIANKRLENTIRYPSIDDWRI